MRLDELIENWLDTPDVTRHVAWGAGTEELSPRGDLGSDTAGPRLLLVRPGMAQVADDLPGIVAGLGGREVALLLLPSAVGDLSAGPLLAALARSGGLLVGVHEVENRLVRTALAVTADPAVPIRAHVVMDEIGIGGDSAAVRNEWLLVGSGQRARVHRLENRLRGHNDEVTLLRTERNIARTRWESEKATSRELRGTIAELEKSLAAAQAQVPNSRKNSPSALTRGASRMRENPVQGSRKVARAVARRLRG